MITGIVCPVCQRECFISVDYEPYDASVNAGGVWYITGVEEPCECSVLDEDGFVLADWAELAEAALRQDELTNAAIERDAALWLE